MLTTEDHIKYWLDGADYYIQGRYPIQKNKLYKIATKEFTRENLNKIKDNYLWLRSLIK